MTTQVDIDNMRAKIAALREKIAALRAQKASQSAVGGLQPAHDPFQAQAKPEGPSRLKQEMQAGAGLLAGMVMPPFDPNQPDRDTPKLLGSETLAGAVNMVPASAQAVADIFSVANPMSPDYGMALHRLKNKPIVQTAAELAMALGMASGAAGGVAGIAKRMKSAPVAPRPAVSPTVAKPAMVEPFKATDVTTRSEIPAAKAGMTQRTVPEAVELPGAFAKQIQDNVNDWYADKIDKPTFDQRANALWEEVGSRGNDFQDAVTDVLRENPMSKTPKPEPFRIQTTGMGAKKVPETQSPVIGSLDLPKIAEPKPKTVAVKPTRVSAKQVTDAIAAWEASGRVAFRHPKNGTVSLNGGKAIPEAEAVARINDAMQSGRLVAPPRPTPDISQPIASRVSPAPKTKTPYEKKLEGRASTYAEQARSASTEKLNETLKELGEPPAWPSDGIDLMKKQAIESELSRRKSSSPAPQVAVKGKEPWEMTAKEYRQSEKTGKRTLYRGDATDVSGFDVSKGQETSLFGQGIYLTDRKRVAGDYTSKGGDKLFTLSSGTKAKAVELFTRQIAKGIDEQGKPLPFGTEKSLSVSWDKSVQQRLSKAAEIWEKEYKPNVDVRAMTDGRVVIQKKAAKGKVSVTEVPESVLSKMIDAEAEIPESVAASLHDALRKVGDRQTAKDLYDFAMREDESGQRPSFRDVFTSLSSDSPLFDAAGQAVMREYLSDYTGISYAGGITMGGGKHRAYVLWDNATVNKGVGAHKAAVRDALRSGHPVPASVLADYPDLAAKYANPQSASPAVAAKEVIAETKAVEPPKPPVETPKPVAEAEPQGKYVSLKKAEGAEIRKRMRLDELDPVERQTFEDTWDRVAKDGKAEDALNIARDVIENGRKNKVMDDHAALLQKSIEIERTMDEAGRNLTEAAKRGDDATVTSEMARILNLNEEMDLVTRASDMMGTEAGRGLSVRRMRADKESLSLAHVLQTARSNKGKALSPAEVVEFESSVKRIKDLEVENTKLVEDNSRIAAERDKAVAERVRRAEGQRVADPAKKAALRDKLATERANLEKQLAAMGNQMNAVVGPPTEAMHLLGKLAANYIKEGAVSLEDVVGQIKKKFPNVADRDVWEALQARSPEAQRAAKKVVERNLSEFKKQARLLTEIDNIEKGISEKPTNPLSKSQEAARTRELRKRLTELRKSLYESSLPADRLESSIKTLNELQDHLANKTRPAKKGAPEIPAEVKPIKEQIAVLRRQMKAEDVLADLQEQLKTGEFKVEAKKKPFVTPELERNQILINQARRQLREALEAKKPMTVGRRAGAVVSGLREVAATADVSGTLRQGLVLTARRLFSDPIGLAKRNVDAWRSMLNKYKDEQIHNALKNDPQYTDAVGDGLRLAEKGGEELYHSPLVERIPGFGKVAQMSERHMRTYLNVMRWDAYKKFREAAPNATKAERAAIARSLNVMSGYGDLRTAPQALSVMSKVFFAPRFAVSRFQTPKLILDYWKEPRVRKEIAKNYAATAAFGASILALAKMMGGEVGDDPRSADFGKVRFGDSRYDLWGGFQQPMRLLFRLGMVGTDRIGLTGTDLKDYEKDTDPFDLVSQFAVYKLAPHVTLPVELVRGKTVIGEKTTPVETIARSVVPFMLRDIREAYKQEGVGPAVTTGLVSAFGGGVGTYPDSETATRIKARRLVAENKTKEAQQILAEWNRNNPKNRITNP